MTRAVKQILVFVVSFAVTVLVYTLVHAIIMRY